MATYFLPGMAALNSPGLGASPAPSGAGRAALDNLLRRELKVSDPTDPRQIATALMDRYRNDVRAQAIEQEARGLPFLQVPAAAAPALAAPTATGSDLLQAIGDVEADLRDLTVNNLLKDIAPELVGWGDTIQAAIDSGTSAARYAIDPRQRDAAFAARRQLGEYARLARLVGALTPAVNTDFRNLAQSLDEVAAVILVTMGESLANLGFAGGRYLMQVPFTELQVRRDAVLNALRNLSGATQQAFSPDSWSRGLDAYRQVFNLLEDQGQGELRVVLNEVELGRAMDQLIHLAGDGSIQGLRALGVTAWSQLHRFHRLIQVTLRLEASPPLAAFQDALQLFIDAFTAGGGFRLLRVARPPILFYGLYGYNDMMVADRRLLEMVTRRGPFAEQLDCLTRCACDPTTVMLQIVLDKILFHLDRAIDNYCVGDIDFGIPEARAASYSYLIDALAPLPPVWPWTPPGFVNPIALSPYLARLAEPALLPIAQALGLFRGLLRPIAGHPFLNLWSAEQQAGFDMNVGNNAMWTNGLTHNPMGLADMLHTELCLEKQNDLDWRPVVEQMAAGCTGFEGIFVDALPGSGCLSLVSDRAMAFVDAANPPPRQCLTGEPVIPADLDTSVAHWVFAHP
jgi:hypothetical protein